MSRVEIATRRLVRSIPGISAPRAAAIRERFAPHIPALSVAHDDGLPQPNWAVPQGRVKVGEKAALSVSRRKSLWLSGAACVPFSPRLGWKAQSSSRAEGSARVEAVAKAQPFPSADGQSRFGVLPFEDFEATRGCSGRL
jgi:hypothetical protein